MRNLLLSITLCMCGGMATAQNIATQTVHWYSSEVLKTDDSQAISLTCEFVTKATSIDWVQKGGAKVVTYDIVSQDGTWEDVSQTGEVIFNVKTGELTGTLTFKRSGSKTTVTMVFIVEGKNNMPYEFNINDIQTN